MAELDRLRAEVCVANLELVRRGLVILTWGNVSGIDRELGIAAIKPSGVSYDDLTPEKIVLVRLDDGSVVDGSLKPSSDTPTHLELYRRFPAIGGVCHTHSTHATAFAQAGRPLPCLGTTHADYFYGAVPVTRKLNREEIAADYERNTGVAIAELWRDDPAQAMQVPAALAAGHGPFTWGKSAAHAVENAIVLEEVARMALATASLVSPPPVLDRALLDKHFLRKHGTGAYYGQK